jgi:hypothetical protein
MRQLKLVSMGQVCAGLCKGICVTGCLTTIKIAPVVWTQTTVGPDGQTYCRKRTGGRRLLYENPGSSCPGPWSLRNSLTCPGKTNAEPVGH